MSRLLCFALAVLCAAIGTGRVSSQPPFPQYVAPFTAKKTIWNSEIPDQTPGIEYYNSNLLTRADWMYSDGTVDTNLMIVAGGNLTGYMLSGLPGSQTCQSSSQAYSGPGMTPDPYISSIGVCSSVTYLGTYDVNGVTCQHWARTCSENSATLYEDHYWSNNAPVLVTVTNLLVNGTCQYTGYQQGPIPSSTFDVPAVCEPGADTHREVEFNTFVHKLNRAFGGRIVL